MKIKKHFRSFVFNTTALWFAAYLIKGVTISGGFKSFLITGLVLTLVNLFVRPLIKLLLLPVNLLTLGAFRWLVNVGALYLVASLVEQFQVSSFHFDGYNYQGFIIPQMDVSLFWSFVLTSFVISFITSLIYWLIK